MSSRNGEVKRKGRREVPLDRGKSVFRLYVSGATPKSMQAITNLKQALDSLFDGRYELGVIDIYQEPVKARAAGVAAVPLLIREYPPPVRRFVGDFSSAAHIRSVLVSAIPE